METIKSWRVYYLGALINVIHLPNLPKSYTNWICEQQNRFDDLLSYAYINHMDEISFLDERILNRPCIERKNEQNTEK